MNRPEDNDPIETLLREQNAHVDDNGFTGRVLAALPRRRRMSLRPMVLLGVTAMGSALAILWLPWDSLPPLDWSALLSMNSRVLLPWLLMIAAIASLVWAITVTAQWED